MIQVINMYWERIYLHLDLETDSTELFDVSPRFFLVGKGSLVQTEFTVSYTEGNRFGLLLNITNSGVNRCIQNGTYHILVVGQSVVDEAMAKVAREDAGEDIPEDAVPDSDGFRETVVYYGAFEQLAVWSRNFNYWSNKGIYTVSFIVDQYSEEPELQLLFFNSVSRRISNIPARDPAKRGLKKKRRRFKNPFKNLKKKIRSALKKRQSKIYRFLHEHRNRNEKHILFLSEQDDKLAANMAALYERMKERGLDKEYKIDFSLRRATSQKVSTRSSIRRTLLVARADIILVDDHVPLFDRMVLAQDTTVIQIWHAGAGFKGVGYSRWGHSGCPGPFSCHRQYTYCISGSQHISPFFSEQFGILDEQIIPTGMPRMDSYIDPANRERVTARLYEDYPILRGKKVILFAPTYRGQNRKNAYYPYELIDFEGLYRLCEAKDAVVLFKMHPWVEGEVPIDERYADRLLSLNTYPDINELFYITDLLITDYSSSMYEFLLMKKPMLFFPFDKTQYASSRGFHRDYDSNVPGKICETFEALLEAMWNEDYEFEKVIKSIDQYFDNVDTGNCDRVIDWLILGELPEEYRQALAKKQEEVTAVRRLHIQSKRELAQMREKALEAEMAECGSDDDEPEDEATPDGQAVSL